MKNLKRKNHPTESVLVWWEIIFKYNLRERHSFSQNLQEHPLSISLYLATHQYN